jgi:hypothetical protein
LPGLDNPSVRRFGSAVIQIPEKSGLPSAIRGAGADMFTLPSAFRGIPGDGYLNHWAETEADARALAMTRTAER